MSPHDIIGLPEAAGQSKADAYVSVGLGRPKRLGALFGTEMVPHQVSIFIGLG
jgi:hypothetical protein